MTTNSLRRRTVRIHGHEVSYRMAGEGPTILLIHGIAGSSTTWRAVMPALAENYTVIAPDLLGHGHSAKPRGDYSLGAYASGIRDLLAVLGRERVTLVGHSLGGGVAMQFAYQFPEWAERLVLVASGGLGKEVSPLLKAVTLPGAEYVLPIVLHPRIREAAEVPGAVARRVGWRPSDTMAEVWRSYTTLDRPARPDGLRPHRALGDRPRRPARQRPRPPLPGRGRSDAHRLGRQRPDHSRRPRLPGSRGHSWRPARDPSRCRPLPARGRTPSGSWECSRTSSTRPHPPMYQKTAGASS